jgi:predicted Zn finger-like uncharacterized protein
MKIEREGCRAEYSVADEEIAGRTLEIRCKRCVAATVGAR